MKFICKEAQNLNIAAAILNTIYQLDTKLKSLTLDGCQVSCRFSPSCQFQVGLSREVKHLTFTPDSKQQRLTLIFL